MTTNAQNVPEPNDSLGWTDDSTNLDEGGKAVILPIPPTEIHSQKQPNGGLWAWFQVAAGWCIFFNTWGVLNAFGIFQTYYESGALFTETSATIAWIGSIQALCVVTLGLVSGPLFDRGYLHILMPVGSFMMVFSFMMLSISKTFWEILLAQGFCYGIGAGLVYVPILAILPTYFSTKIGLAVGIAASGSSIGGVIYPIVFYNLVDSIGFSWAVRTLGLIVFVTLLVPLCLLRVRVKPVRPRDFLDWSAFTDWPFGIFTLSTMLGFLGMYVTMFFISYFGDATGIVTPKMAFYLVPILNAGSVFGRTIPNAISDKTGPISMFGPAAIVCGVLTLCMIVVTNLGGLVTIALFYGFFSGVFIALPAVCFVRLTTDKSKIGTRIGMGYAFSSLAVLAGGPGGGGVIGTDVTNLHWNNLWIYGGVATTAGGLMLLALRFWLTKGKFLVKI